MDEPDAPRVATARDRGDGALARFVERIAVVLTRARSVHPFDHHQAFHAVVAAGPPLAELAIAIGAKQLLHSLAIAASDLGSGFTAAPGSRIRTAAYHRAWRAVRDIDRTLADTRRRRNVEHSVLSRAQRAIDRADVEIGALPGVLST